MPLHYDIETDFLYLKGFKVGYLEGKEIALKKSREAVRGEIRYTMVRNFLRLYNTPNRSDEYIADFLDVTVDFVQKVKSDLAKEKP